MSNYFLVTPCKDEEKSLPKLAKSVIEQEITPILWVIVDDGSMDETPNILNDLCLEYSWIKSVRLNEKIRDLGIHVSHVYRIGFNVASTICAESNIEYNYIASVDADMILDNDYFKSLIKEFESNPKLGICSGHIGNLIDGNIIWADYKEDLPSGGARLWKRECFEETGGYLLTCSPDSVSNVKAKLKGWDTKYFTTTRALSTRAYSSAEGQWKGYKKLGSNNYFIGYSPIHILLKGCKMLYSKNGFHNHGVGIAYYIGYFEQYFKLAPRIEDDEILNYYGSKRLREILCSKLNL